MNTMSAKKKTQCHIAIHTASAAATAAGALPIPVADTVSISTVQVAMILSLSQILHINMSQTAAAAYAKVHLAQKIGHAAFREGVKAAKKIPGLGTVGFGAVAAVTAGTITEKLGWDLVQDYCRGFL